MVIVVMHSGVVLEDPEDLKGFKVVVRHDGDDDSVASTLWGIGRLEDHDTAWIGVEAVREMAAGRVGEGWDAEFAAMLEYASGKGWMSDDGSEIQAHVEWPS